MSFDEDERDHLGVWKENLDGLLFYIGRKRYQVTLTSFFIFLINHFIPVYHTTFFCLHRIRMDFQDEKWNVTTMECDRHKWNQQQNEPLQCIGATNCCYNNPQDQKEDKN